MKRLLGDNPLLAISIALPVLLVVLFAAAAMKINRRYIARQRG